VEAVALIQTLNAEILASASATLTLERWCRDHRLVPLGEQATVRARPLPGAQRAVSEEQRQRLELSPTEDVRYRRVQLVCGDRVLSEAESWYVPGRLTAEMNRLLDTTDTPLGRVIEPLQPYRRTFSVELLWSPLPSGWARQGTERPDLSSKALAIPAGLFMHRALVYSSDHRPFAEVREVYQRDVLAFPPPAAR
jgi:hypothetical protein